MSDPHFQTLSTRPPGLEGLRESDDECLWPPYPLPPTLELADRLRAVSGYDHVPFGVIREFKSRAITASVLIRYRNRVRNDAFPSVDLIAREMSCDRRTVQRHLRALSQLDGGLIRETGARGQKSTVYEFTERALELNGIDTTRRRQGRDGYGVLPRWVHRYKVLPLTKLLYAYLLSRALVLRSQWVDRARNYEEMEVPLHLEPYPTLDRAKMIDRLGIDRKTIDNGLERLVRGRWIGVLPPESYYEYQFVIGPGPDLDGLPSRASRPTSSRRGRPSPRLAGLAARSCGFDPGAKAR
ncbi:helix-turn-helix domain-containing protein [Alienimonas chondri]|uniref:Helix-turn-helix domain-containing protein n=1 Tax=Alienimonas chondri TaxID=2681879 RepID=A0ABX1VKP0_9PLAN|nr:helix-turn-helix domain-containing protein [Alienimonas chondri]NNJ27728.1 hypothetical protein [Alienimonas chondri]